MSAEARMIHRVSVERSTAGSTTDDLHQPVRTFSTVASAVPAAIVTKGARELANLAQAGAVTSTLTIQVPIGTDLTPADRLYHDPVACPVPAPLDLPSRRYQLTGVHDASGAGLFLRADATEVA